MGFPRFDFRSLLLIAINSAFPAAHVTTFTCRTAAFCLYRLSTRISMTYLWFKQAATVQRLLLCLQRLLFLIVDTFFFFFGSDHSKSLLSTWQPVSKPVWDVREAHHYNCPSHRFLLNVIPKLKISTVERWRLKRTTVELFVVFRSSVFFFFNYLERRKKKLA